jgi:hypothetical protein
MVVSKTIGYVYAIEAAFPMIEDAIDPTTSFAASVGLKALGRYCLTMALVLLTVGAIALALRTAGAWRVL